MNAPVASIPLEERHAHMKAMSKSAPLVVLVAALIMLVASPASATVTSAGGGTKASLVTTGSTTFTIGASNITCTTWTVTGTISGSSASAAVAGTIWNNCTAAIVGFPAGSAAVGDTGPQGWTITVSAALGGGSFSASVTTAALITITTLVCTIQIPAQTLSGLTWTNATRSLAASVSSIAYTSEGIFCPLPESGDDASFSGSFSEPTITVS